MRPEFLEHGVTVISLFGKQILSTQGNLFEMIKAMGEAFVVDTHIDWEGLSAKEEHANKAFIIGTTLDKERSHRLSLFENQEGPKVRHNVFFFGMRSQARQDIPIGGLAPALWIERLDKYCLTVRDRDKILKGDNCGVRFDYSWSINEEKKKLLRILGVEDISHLERETHQTRSSKHTAFLDRIRCEQPKCFKDFIKSIEVARYAYADLLLNRKNARNLFGANHNPNVFGDCELIQNALFWNAQILSNDNGVRYMANRCGVRFPIRPL